MPITPQPKPAGDMVPIPLVLPKPQFVGTPQNIQGIANLEKPLRQTQRAILRPQGNNKCRIQKAGEKLG